jgi:pimeloyl-ACP methyl ester carboxylesterase
MILRRLRCLSLVALLLVQGLAAAGGPSEIGVVVMHGKWDSPQGHVQGLAADLGHAGFLVKVPEMPWSGRRGYDRGAAGLIEELDAEIAELKAKGAKKIALVGHSQGAAAALYYSTQRAVDGIALIAAGGHAQSKQFIPHYQQYVGEAQGLVAQGKADESLSFEDLNTGNRTRRMRTSARILLDYFDPEGPFNTYKSAAAIKSGTAVLVIIPTRDSEGLKRVAGLIQEKLPDGTRVQRSEISADHLEAPNVAAPIVRDWLLGL